MILSYFARKCKMLFAAAAGLYKRRKNVYNEPNGSVSAERGRSEHR